MHRDLKGEATGPPRKNLQSEQVKLNNFIKEYNEIRPHESLGMQPLFSVHKKSIKSLPDEYVSELYDRS